MIRRPKTTSILAVVALLAIGANSFSAIPPNNGGGTPAIPIPAVDTAPAQEAAAASAQDTSAFTAVEETAVLAEAAAPDATVSSGASAGNWWDKSGSRGNAIRTTTASFQTYTDVMAEQARVSYQARASFNASASVNPNVNAGDSTGTPPPQSGKPNTSRTRTPESGNWWDKSGSRENAMRTSTGSFQTFTDTQLERARGKANG